MSKFNRWVYAAVGVIVLLLAGLVYAWSVIGKSIGELIRNGRRRSCH